MGESDTPPREELHRRSGRLASERVIINAPMSFAGSAQRAWRRAQRSNIVARIGLILVALLLIPIWWVTIAAWYVVFGLFLVPYRLLRRGAPNAQGSTTERYIHAAQVLFPGAADRGEDRIFAKIEADG